MTNESNEIHQNLLDKRSHIASLIQAPVKDVLEKGNIAEVFTYGDNKVLISKKGSEIKTSLNTVKAGNDGKIAVIKAQMDAILVKCGVVPTEPMYYDSYGITPKTTDIKRFTWREVDEYAKSNSTAVVAESSTTDTILGEVTVAEVKKVEENCLRTYNDLAYQYCSLQKDNTVVETMISGLNDKETYKLTIAQANAIGL